MKRIDLVAVMAVLVLGACQSTTAPPPAEEVIQVQSTADQDNARRNAVRSQLEKSIDQYWQHYVRQEYGTSDGIAAVLERYVKDNYDVVAADLRTASPRWRKNAAAALGFSDRKESVPDLLGALQDPYQDVILAALLSLWNFAKRDVPIPGSAIAPYLSHSDADIRSNAAMVLSHSTTANDGALFLPLTAALEDPDDSVRVHAAAALGSLGDADAVPFLLKTLKDPKPLVRIRAAFALGRIRDPRAVPSLIDRLDDPDEDVAKAVHKALQTIAKVEIERNKKAWEAFWSQHVN